MNRRSFIAYSSLATVGALVSSSSLNTALAPFEQAIRLPSSTTQVRHGMYELKAIKNRFLPKWITIFESNTFLKNGFEAEANDLNLFQFDLKDESFVVGYDNETISISTEDESYTLADRQQIKLSKPGFSIQLLEGKQDFKQSIIDSESICIVLKGSAKVNGKKLEQDEFAYVSNKLSYVVVNEKSLVILVGRRVLFTT